MGLVLGGGGSRGLAHLGVIQEMEKENIPIDYIGGTSQGAFMGAMYVVVLFVFWPFFCFVCFVGPIYRPVD